MSPAPDDLETPPAHIAYVVVSLIAASLVTNAAHAVLPVVAPEAARAFGVPAALIGYQISLATLGALCALLFLGNLSARWGSCRVIQVALLAQAAFMCLLLAQDLTLLLVASLGMGAGYALLTPAISPLLQRYTPAASRNLIFSYWQTGIPLGLVLAAAAAPIVTVTFGWQGAVLGGAALLLVPAVMVEPLRRQADASRDRRARLARSPVPGIRIVLRDRGLRRMAVAAPCFTAAQFAFSAYTVVTLVEGLGFGLVQAGLVMTGSQLAGALIRPVCGWIADRTRRPIATMTGLAVVMLLATLATAPMAPGWPVAVIVLVFAAIGASTNGHPGVMLAEVAHRAPHGEVASTTAGMLLFTNLGRMLGPIAFANVFLLTGSYTLTIASTAVFAVICILALAARRAR